MAISAVDCTRSLLPPLTPLPLLLPLLPPPPGPLPRLLAPPLPLPLSSETSRGIAPAASAAERASGLPQIMVRSSAAAPAGMVVPPSRSRATKVGMMPSAARMVAKCSVLNESAHRALTTLACLSLLLPRSWATSAGMVAAGGMAPAAAVGGAAVAAVSGGGE